MFLRRRYSSCNTSSDRSNFDPGPSYNRQKSGGGSSGRLLRPISCHCPLGIWYVIPRAEFTHTFLIACSSSGLRLVSKVLFNLVVIPSPPPITLVMLCGKHAANCLARIWKRGPRMRPATPQAPIKPRVTLYCRIWLTKNHEIWRW